MTVCKIKMVTYAGHRSWSIYYQLCSSIKHFSLFKLIVEFFIAHVQYLLYS